MAPCIIRCAGVVGQFATSLLAKAVLGELFNDDALYARQTRDDAGQFEKGISAIRLGTQGNDASRYLRLDQLKTLGLLPN